jgi:cytochrome c-type biogenesis protein
MGETFKGLAMNGPLLVAVAVAALAGLASFLSPCVLPLVPGYLSYVTGLAGADLDSGQRRGRVLAGTALFVVGLGAVFVTVTVIASQVSSALGLIEHRRPLEIIGGVLIIVLGLAFMGLVPWLQREWRIHRLPAAGLVGAPVFGAVFALSWIPCTGPTLGAVLTLAATGGSMPRAVTLAIAYCLGLGLPFLAFGLGFRRALGVVKVVRRNSRWVTRIGGAMLIVVGIALVSGLWLDFVIWLQARVGLGSLPI